MLYGDSITQEGFGGRVQPWNTGDTSYPLNGGGLTTLLETATGRKPPVLVNAGYGGLTSVTADANKARLAETSSEYVTLAFGTNDANNVGEAPIDANSPVAIAFKSSMQSMIDYVHGLGRTVILPKIPYANQRAYTAANIAVLNVKIDELLAANPTVIRGPNPYPLFQSFPSLLRDGVHPSYDGVGVEGLTGYEHLLRLWRDALQEELYTTNG